MLEATARALVALAFFSGQEAWSDPRPITAVAGSPGDSVLVTSNPAFRASLARISERSALWRQAVQTVRDAGRYAVILTPDQVVVSRGSGDESPFDEGFVAETAPIPDMDSEVHVVLVVVNLALLERIHRDLNSLPAEFEADLDRILIHEIYGHAFPYLTAGNLSGQCADPRADQRPSDACSIRRENAVRAELGLGRRADYGLEGLSLARRTMQIARPSASRY